jgi:hypothetical protein
MIAWLRAQWRRRHRDGSSCTCGPVVAAETPDTLDEAFDRAAAVVQQAREMVIRHVTYGVLGEDDTLIGNLRYRRTDPYAVEATFSRPSGGEVIKWEFARDLLHWGAVDREHAGLHDVRVYERDGDTLVLALSSPDGSIALTVPRADVAGFLRETYAVVPRGAESEHLGLDAALADLLGGEVR